MKLVKALEPHKFFLLISVVVSLVASCCGNVENLLSPVKPIGQLHNVLNGVAFAVPLSQGTSVLRSIIQKVALLGQSKETVRET